MNVLFKGFKGEVSEELQQGGGRIQTGKSPMTYGLCRKINLYFLTEKTFESICARAFFTLTWNLMYRAKSTCSVHLHHIEWCDDSLAVFLHMQKMISVAKRS